MDSRLDKEGDEDMRRPGCSEKVEVSLDCMTCWGY